MTNVIRFPPLPPVPEPFGAKPDDRQRVFQRIAGNLCELASSDSGHIAVANTVRGFRASAVDIGVLQDLLAKAIAELTIEDVRERWSDDLFPWFTRAIMSWVQRCKSIQFSLEGSGVGVELETQDDRGYYRYRFDVFPGRKRFA
jgi:hypothetical protein